MKRENSQREIPTVLTIAGSDSGGGAGLQADLKTFASVGVHGATVVTCVTAQNPRKVLGVQACKPSIIRAQLAAVAAELPPAAAKTGMLYSASIIRTVASFLRAHPLPLIVDPVMVATSGAALLDPAAVNCLSRQLFPLAELITPNLGEAEVLLGARLKSVKDLRQAARELRRRFGVPALVKGGHLRIGKEAVDIYYDGTNELLLSAPFVRGVHTHGTGCTYSAAIAAYRGKGLTLPEAVGRAKEFITQAIVQHVVTAGHSVLNSFWEKANA